MKKITWLTRLANKIRGWRWPWLSRFLGILQNNVIIPAFSAVGDTGRNYITSKILEESRKDIPGLDKFKNVYDDCRKYFSSETIRNDWLANIIQNLVSSLKTEGLL